MNGDISLAKIVESGKLTNAVKVRSVNFFVGNVPHFLSCSPVQLTSHVSSLKLATLILLMDPKHPNKVSFSISIHLLEILFVLFTVSTAPDLRVQQFICI